MFVIEAAEAMAEESQNALLKTLEEPPPFAHLILISAEPEALLETVRSRCRPVRFARLGPDAVEARLDPGADPAERRAAARLADGDPERAAFLLAEQGRALRGRGRGARAAPRAGRARRRAVGGAGRGRRRRGRARGRTSPRARRRGRGGGRRARRARRRAGAPARPRTGQTRAVAPGAHRRPSTSGLGLLGAWLRDLAAVGEGAAELAAQLRPARGARGAATGLDPRRARRAAELVMDTRRRLQVNVSEALALEALAYRLEFLLDS